MFNQLKAIFMKNILSAILLLFVSASFVFASDAEIGEEAPNFTLPDYLENNYTLSDYRGKWVVLEWVNFGCPFVKKHYDGDNMQTLQEEYQKKGVTWLSICSSAPGKQGYYDNDEIANKIMDYKAKPYAYLIDADGEVGQSYGAKTTPHMFIINPDGVLIYAGAIDDIKSTDKEDVANAKNYVRLVLDAVLEGNEPPVTSTKAYGCSVKYAD